MSQKEAVMQYVDAHKEEMIALWRDLVNTEGGTHEKEYVDVVARKVCGIFTDLGFECQLHDLGPNNGMTLTGIWGADRPGKPILFSGHYDTVFKHGTFGSEPFHIEENGRARGPGCLDMKGGIVITVFVLKALMSLGYQERPIKILFCGDEEKGHVGAPTSDLIKEFAAGCLCAFNMETGLVSNDICVGRKGDFSFLITVHGVGAHSGNDFLKGRSAIHEMARKILDLEKMTDLEKGTTVSATLINGGTSRASIAPECTIDADVRYELFSELERIKSEITAMCAHNYIEGTTTEVKLVPQMAAFETTERGLRLAQFISDISQECGFGPMGTTRLGGGADSSYISQTGTPTVCSMGVRGEFNHTDREYALVDTLYERTKLLTMAVLRAADFS